MIFNEEFMVNSFYIVIQSNVMVVVFYSVLCAHIQ